MANAQGQYSVAVGWCQQAIRRMPKSPEAWYNLGIAYRGLGQGKQSIAALKQSSSLTRDNSDAQNSIGLQFLELGALREAEQCLRRALSLAPRFAFAHSNLGMLYEKEGRLEEAESSFKKALEIQPDLAQAYINLSAVLNRQKKYELAEVVARKSLEINPKSVETWRNRGAAFLDQEKYIDAIPCFLESLRLDPNGESLLSGARSGEIQEQAWSLYGDRVLGNLLSARMHLCDWSSFAETLDLVVQQIANGRRVISPFPILALTDDPAVHRQVAAQYVQDEAPGCSDLGLEIKPPCHEKLRIGYYSADFQNHATMYLMAELFELHDKNKFELIGFSFGPDIQDEMRARVSAAFDQFIDVRHRSDKEVAQLSRDLEIDIAVDLKGYTKDARSGIFAYRAAPVQVNYLGYPGTMAASYMDYIVADRVLIPEESQVFYAEKVVYLPDSYQVNDTRRQIAPREFTRAELGFPASGFVFACFNNNHKITPSVFEGWMRILKRVPGSVLWLFKANPDAAANLRHEASVHGVDSERLVFAERVPLPEHLARIALADLFLDTLPYNAHTTTSDALWAGLPVLTCLGQSFAARVAASLLNAIGLSELITTTQQDYENLAVELASTPDRLQSIKQKLARNRLAAPLFDAKKFTGHLETAYKAMHERFRAGLSPGHIYLAQDARGAE